MRASSPHSPRAFIRARLRSLYNRAGSIDHIIEQQGVAAFNVVDDVSLRAVIDAASELDSPLIVQTSLKTVKSIGAKVLYAMFRSMADEAPVPITLHLDHCPEREIGDVLGLSIDVAHAGSRHRTR